MLHLIGLGLHEPRGMSLLGLERARSAKAVYVEFYTAAMAGGMQALVEVVGRPVELLDRLGVERGAPRLVEEARLGDVALLVPGDPLAATTHTDLLVRARGAGVRVVVTHAASIFSAAPGLLGLQHYKMGRTTTLVRPRPGWNPQSPFHAVAENHERGLHTLVLLDLQVDEGYFMTATEGLERLLDLAERAGSAWFGPDTPVGVVARAGSVDPALATGPASHLRGRDFGPPLHCILVPGEMQVVEREAWAQLALPPAARRG
ncbi:MAG: diphthine synthase [Thermoplasmatota archaeon]